MRARPGCRAPALLLCLILLPWLLAGCWDHRELEEMAFVMAIGLDRGEQAELKLSALIAIPAKQAGDGGGGAGQRVMFTTVQASGLMDAFALMDSYIDRQVSFAQASLIIWGEDLARAGIVPSLEPLTRYNAFRRDMRIMVARRQEAGELLQNLKPVLEADPVRYLQFFEVNMPETGLIPRLGNLHSLASELEHPGVDSATYLVALRREEGDRQQGNQGGDAATMPQEQPDGGSPGHRGTGPEWLPGMLPRSGGPNADLIGAAIISQGRMVGEATGPEMRIIHMIRGTFDRTYYSAADLLEPDKAVLVQLRRARAPRLRVNVQGDRPEVRVHVPLEAELAGARSGYDYTQPLRHRRLGASIAAELEGQTEQLIEKAQQVWQADPFGFGARAARQFATHSQWKAFSWHSKWPTARVQVTYDVIFRRFGTQLAPGQFGQTPPSPPGR